LSLTGAMVLLVPLIVYWQLQGALPEMFKQLMVFPLTTYGKTSSLPFPKFSAQTLLAEKATALLFYLSPFVQAIAAIWLSQRLIRRRFYRREAVLAFLFVWSALFYLQALTRSDMNHLFITLPPFFLLAAYCWRIFLNVCGELRILKITASVVAATAVACFLWAIHPVSLPELPQANEILALDRGGVRVDDAQWLADFVRGVQDRVPPNRSILSLPYQPMLYFLCERRNPTRWNYLWPGDQTKADHDALIKQARSDPPAVVFITGEKEMASYASAILDYVHADYRRVADFGRMTVYFPRDATP
jgi:hypothetical protein